MTSVEILRSNPAGATPPTIYLQTLLPGQQLMLRFEVEQSVGKLYISGLIEPVIVLDTQPVDIEIECPS